jgi:hypothetical protein
MTINAFRMGAPNIAYIGAGVTVKGAIFVPDAIVVDGVVEGDVTAQSIRIGPTGAIREMSSPWMSTSPEPLPITSRSRNSC